MTQTARNGEKFTFNFAEYGDLDKVRKTHDDLPQNLLVIEDVLSSCPHLTNDFPAFFYVTNERNEIISSMGAYPDILHYENRRFPWAWLSDIVTKKEYEGKGLATIVIQGALPFFDQREIGCGVIFSNPVSMHILKKSGFSLLGYLSRYVILKSTKPFLKEHVRWAAIVKPLDCVLSSILHVYYRLCILMHTWLKGSKDIELGQDCQNDPVSSTILSERVYRKALHFDDSYKRLKWKLKACNLKDNCSLHIVRTKKNGNSSDPLAYFIARFREQIDPLAERYKDFKRMTVMDFGLLKNNSQLYPIVAMKILDLFNKSEAEVLDVVSSLDEFGTVLRRLGAVRLGRGFSLMYRAPTNWNLQWDSDINNWELTHFSGDVFIF